MAVFTMPFGKHKGTPIDEVPLDYLEWALGGGMDRLRPETKEAFVASINRRKKPAVSNPDAAEGPSVDHELACPGCGQMLRLTLTAAADAVPF